MISRSESFHPARNCGIYASADAAKIHICFVKNGGITEDFVKELSKYEPLRVVFRDAGFKNDSVKINVEQIFKLMSPHTDIKTI